MRRALRRERWNRPVLGLAGVAGLRGECLGLFERATASVVFAPELRAARGTTAAEKGRLAWLRGDDGAARRLLAAASSDGGFSDLWRAQAEGEERASRSALARVRKPSAIPFALTWAGWLSLSAGNPGRAARELSAAARHAPDHAAAQLLLGLARERLGQPAGAASAFAAAAALDPRTSGLHVLKGRALLGAGRERAALAAFDEASDLSPDALDAFLLILAPPADGGRLEVHRLNRALSAKLDRRLARDPRAWWAWALRGALSADFGDLLARSRRGEGDLARARRLRPRAWIFAQSARRALDPSPEVERFLDRAVKLRPDVGWLRAWRGEYRARAAQPGARADLDAAARLSPDYAFTFAWRAGLRLRGGDLAGAAADARRALELQPQLAAAWHIRGLLGVAAGRLPAALADLAKSATLDPAARRSALPSAYLGSRLNIDPARLEARLERLADGDESGLASLWLGELLLKRAKPQAALGALERAAACGLAPVLKGWALLWRSEALLTLNEPRASRSTLTEALRCNPDLQSSLSWKAAHPDVRAAAA